MCQSAYYYVWPNSRPSKVRSVPESLVEVLFATCYAFWPYWSLVELFLSACGHSGCCYTENPNAYFCPYGRRCNSSVYLRFRVLTAHRRTVSTHMASLALQGLREARDASPTSAYQQQVVGPLHLDVMVLPKIWWGECAFWWGIVQIKGDPTAYGPMCYSLST